MILEVDNIELSYDGKLILDAVYLKAETGKITGILGRNGSGKTSLLSIIYGITSPKYKLIRVDGLPITKKMYKTGLIAYLPQFSYLPTHMTLKKAFYLYEISWKDFVAKFPSFEALKNYIKAEISGGELRLVETYLILLSEAKILLLDEPFSNLSPLYIDQLKAILFTVKKEKVILLTDHFYTDVLDAADEIYLCKNRKLKGIKNQQELIENGYLPLDAKVLK
ncbi:ATP-binding cassette domain-containing protein [Mesonia ostreae]|uniref:ATP-binding cassette domain-containing protein n=1 Tax=Mesonia ostreae TaxID=861110 RepID=A0ABU2KEL9_9FLAO|nr:ATP-binding cassette domain-containing protein [Mesonia ostreae]MDT0293148.1 ATP-binding cassette domain-containing protein [Mesonia ostreae]